MKKLLLFLVGLFMALGIKALEVSNLKTQAYTNIIPELFGVK